jgi:hypothetical protein
MRSWHDTLIALLFCSGIHKNPKIKKMSLKESPTESTLIFLLITLPRCFVIVVVPGWRHIQSTRFNHFSLNNACHKPFKIHNLMPHDNNLKNKKPQKGTLTVHAIRHVFVGLALYRIKLLSSYTNPRASV